MEDTNLCTLHAKRITISVKDMHLALRIRGEYFHIAKNNDDNSKPVKIIKSKEIIFEELSCNRRLDMSESNDDNCEPLKLIKSKEIFFEQLKNDRRLDMNKILSMINSNKEKFKTKIIPKGKQLLDEIYNLVDDRNLTYYDIIEPVYNKSLNYYNTIPSLIKIIPLIKYYREELNLFDNSFKVEREYGTLWKLLNYLDFDLYLSKLKYKFYKLNEEDQMFNYMINKALKDCKRRIDFQGIYEIFNHNDDCSKVGFLPNEPFRIAFFGSQIEDMLYFMVNGVQTLNFEEYKYERFLYDSAYRALCDSFPLYENNFIVFAYIIKEGSLNESNNIKEEKDNFIKESSEEINMKFSQSKEECNECSSDSNNNDISEYPISQQTNKKKLKDGFYLPDNLIKLKENEYLTLKYIIHFKYNSEKMESD